MATFTGWRKVKSELNRLLTNLRRASKVDVGFLPNAKYPDGTPVAAVAAANEFGTPRIPPRPFFRTTIAKHKDEWGPGLGKLITEKGYNARTALDAAGQAIAGQVRQGIVDMNDPPNAPATLRQKKGSKPLVDTGHMLNSVDKEVK